MWRVRDRSTFASFRGAPRVRRGLITVTWVPSEAAVPAVAFAVSTKVGNAVRRNRLRRRLRELARTSALPGGSWLVVAAPGAADAPFPTLAEWWGDAVAGLLSKGAT